MRLANDAQGGYDRFCLARRAIRFACRRVGRVKTQALSLTLAPVAPLSDGPMPAISLDALDLAALLCSRVCHDVISPVGAIVNGLEVLEEEKDAEMRAIATEVS